MTWSNGCRQSFATIGLTPGRWTCPMKVSWLTSMIGSRTPDICWLSTGIVTTRTDRIREQVPGHLRATRPARAVADAQVCTDAHVRAGEHVTTVCASGISLYCAQLCQQRLWRRPCHSHPA